jgi:hypothetical protein
VDRPRTSGGPAEYYLRTGVDLSDFAGQHVRVRWRLLQDSARPDSLPGLEWFVEAPRFFDVIVDPACPPPLPGGPPVSSCSDQPFPPPFAVANVTDDGERVPLRIRVALDVEEGGPIALLEQDGEPEEAAARMALLEAEARELLEPMGEAYDRLGIDVELSFDLLAPLDAHGVPRQRPLPPPTDQFRRWRRTRSVISSAPSTSWRTASRNCPTMGRRPSRPPCAPSCRRKSRSPG